MYFRYIHYTYNSVHGDWDVQFGCRIGLRNERDRGWGISRARMSMLFRPTFARTRRLRNTPQHFLAVLLRTKWQSPEISEILCNQITKTTNTAQTTDKSRLAKQTHRGCRQTSWDRDAAPPLLLREHSCQRRPLLGRLSVAAEATSR